MSEELKAAGLEAKFGATLRQAEELSELDPEDRAAEFRTCVGTIESYESARRSFVDVTGLPDYLDEVTLSGEATRWGRPDYGSQLQQVVTNSESAITYLGKSHEQVPNEVKDKLDSLTGLISIIQEVEPDLYAHLIIAIREHEKTHYLAATVLSAKTIGYVLGKLDGEDDQTKADILVKKGLLEKELKDGFTHTWKKARNYYVHDIRASPQPGESLSILTTACQLAEMYIQAQ